MKRGEVWWAELEGDAGFRPVIIVSRTEFIDRRQNLTIAEITRVVRGIPCEVTLRAADGMPVDCVINTDNLHTIPQDSLREYVLSLSEDQLGRLDHALRYSLELEP